VTPYSLALIFSAVWRVWTNKHANRAFEPHNIRGLRGTSQWRFRKSSELWHLAAWYLIYCTWCRNKTTVIFNIRHFNMGPRTVRSAVIDWSQTESAWVTVLCFFLSCKANARVKLAKTRHGPHSSTLVVVLFGCYLCCSMYFLCALYNCYRVTTQLQLINMSISMSTQ
jgi:hypothetical protein